LGVKPNWSTNNSIGNQAGEDHEEGGLSDFAKSNNANPIVKSLQVKADGPLALNFGV